MLILHPRSGPLSLRPPSEALGRLRGGRGLTFQQVQKYEKGMNRMGSSRLQQAANVLGVTVPFFFEGVPDRQSPGQAASSPDYVTEFVASHDGLRLIKAFKRLDTDALRRRIVGLVEEIALRGS